MEKGNEFLVKLNQLEKVEEETAIEYLETFFGGKIKNLRGVFLNVFCNDCVLRMVRIKELSVRNGHGKTLRIKGHVEGNDKDIEEIDNLSVVNWAFELSNIVSVMEEIMKEKDLEKQVKEKAV